jgi:hypothetical protein
MKNDPVSIKTLMMPLNTPTPINAPLAWRKAARNSDALPLAPDIFLHPGEPALRRSDANIPAPQMQMPRASPGHSVYHNRD